FPHRGCSQDTLEFGNLFLVEATGFAGLQISFGLPHAVSDTLVAIRVCQHNETCEPLLLLEGRNNRVANNAAPFSLFTKLKLARHYSGVHHLTSLKEIL